MGCISAGVKCWCVVIALVLREKEKPWGSQVALCSQVSSDGQWRRDGHMLLTRNIHSRGSNQVGCMMGLKETVLSQLSQICLHLLFSLKLGLFFPWVSASVSACLSHYTGKMGFEENARNRFSNTSVNISPLPLRGPKVLIHQVPSMNVMDSIWKASCFGYIQVNYMDANARSDCGKWIW